MAPKDMDAYIKVAELTGMVIAGSVENSNRRDHRLIVNSTDACINHINETLPVAKSRMFFTGGSGGGARTFIFAEKYAADCAGAMPYVAGTADRQVICASRIGTRKRKPAGVNGGKVRNRMISLAQWTRIAPVEWRGLIALGG